MEDGKAQKIGMTRSKGRCVTVADLDRDTNKLDSLEARALQAAIGKVMASQKCATYGELCATIKTKWSDTLYWASTYYLRKYWPAGVARPTAEVRRSGKKSLNGKHNAPKVVQVLINVAHKAVKRAA
ncbi:MAG TPA: hypothetical protein VEA59_01695 [Patescibacteria group bacterium]|nr:hypothetical protein [Patescibacteria group bacterium]